MISKKCWNCGEAFQPRQFATHQLFCSDKCRVDYHKNKKQTQYFDALEFDCAQCGRRVRVETPDDKRTRFCCKECEKKYWKHPPHENESSHTNFHSAKEYLSWERRTNA